MESTQTKVSDVNINTKQDNSNLGLKQKKSKQLIGKKIIKTVKTNNEIDAIIDDQKIIPDKERKSAQEDMFSPYRSIKPTTFQLVSESNIINDKLEEQFIWSEGTSFTAKEQYGEYYKISGFFIDKKWVKSSEDLYIPVQFSNKK